MKIFSLAPLFLIGAVSGRSHDLPVLPQNLCDYDTIYSQIKTGNTVEVTMEVRYRDCPSNKANQPCGIANEQGYSPGSIADGVRSHMITINDATPGPIIRAKLGDTVKVKVINYLGEPTTMHFHGMTQFRTPFADGDDNINNCPIPVGASYEYEFTAHPAGSTFYHAHVKSQRGAGMSGALIVEDPDEEEIPDKVVLFQDWYHEVRSIIFFVVLFFILFF
jgi:FtsP/CotA-like multicopper oxidase with cupredoxin domain